MEIYKFQHLDREISIGIHTKSDAISKEIVRHDTFFELVFLEYLRLHYNNQRVIIDIGANIGNHSLFFSEFLTYDKIYCFEPEVENLEILRYNMANKNCEIFDIALSDQNGTANLYTSEAGNSGAFSLEQFDKSMTVGSNHPLISSFIVKENIQVRTLDSYNLQDVSMIKIDVENHELKVLEGGRQTILNNKPIILVENLHYVFPAIPGNKFDAFFSSINYIKLAADLGGFYMDLWGPNS